MLNEYLHDRIEKTSFSIFDISDSFSIFEEECYAGLPFCKAFFYDHKNQFYQTSNENSLKQFILRGNKIWKDNIYLIFGLFEINNRILNKISKLLQKMKTKNYSKEIIFNLLFHETLEEIQTFIQSKPSINWFLSMPEISSMFENEEENRILSCYDICFQIVNECKNQIKRFIQKYKLQTEVDFNEINTILLTFHQTLKLKSEENKFFKTLIENLWPSYIQPIHWIETMKELKNLKRQLDPSFRVDLCVYCFRKNRYLLKGKALLWQVISLENEKNSCADLFFLFRGTNPSLHKDELYRTSSPSSNPCQVHSLSFGMSLFAGIFYDRTGTVYNFLIKDKIEGFILPLQKCSFLKSETNEEIDNPQNWFYVPPIPMILQWNGLGEFFHPRTKIYIDEKVKSSRKYFVSGLHECSYASVPVFLQSQFPLTDEHFETLFLSRKILLNKEKS